MKAKVLVGMVIFGALASTLGACASKEKPQAPRGATGNKERQSNRGLDAKTLPLVAEDERERFLASYSQEIIKLVEGDGSSPIIESKISSVCEQFQLKYQQNNQNGEVLRPICTGSKPDIDSSTLLNRVGTAAEGTSLIARAIKIRDLNIVKAILNFSNLHESDKNGKTMPMLAAEHGKVDIVRALAQNGVDLSLLDNSGCNIMCYADQFVAKSSLSTSQKEEFISEIREAIKLSSVLGRTELLVSAIETERSKRDLAKIAELIALGANINARTAGGRPLIRMAVDDFHLELCQMLLNTKGIDLTFRIARRGMRGETQNIREYAEWLKQYKSARNELEFPAEADEIIRLLKAAESEGLMSGT